MAVRTASSDKRSTSYVLWTATLLVGVLCGTLLSFVLFQTSSITQFAASTPNFQIQNGATATQQYPDPRNPLAIPQGKAVALPSLIIPQKESAKIDRQNYGGAGDKVHLGGFIDIDHSGLSPALWKDMVTWFGVRSIMDVGCGRGISTTWFITHGVDTLCIEGSHDARQTTLLPDPESQMVEHDYARGPWWPEKTYDAVWCVEFLEHVGRNFHINYFATFRKAALIFATHSWRGGWHHVEVHEHEWWIAKFESYGFRYSESLTQRIKQAANREEGKAPDGEIYNGNYIKGTMKVFINPLVASLPEHAHLFAEPGCFEDTPNSDGTPPANTHRDCFSEKHETPIPEHFQPLPLTPEMDQAWEELLKKNIRIPQQGNK